MITRKEVIQKINDYIEKRTSKEETYNWALRIIISKEYDKIHNTDILLSDAIHTLLCLHDAADDKSGCCPSIEELKSYRNKLLLPSE